MLHCSFLTSAYQGVNGCSSEAGSTVSFGVHADDDVGLLDILLIFVHAQPVGDLSQNLCSRLQFVGTLGQFLHVDAYHVVCSHLVSHVGREIVTQSTVDKYHVVFPHRGEDSWYRHAGSHRTAHDAVVEDIFRVVHDIGCHTGKGDG